MKSIFEAIAGTDRREDGYFTPNPELPDMEHEQIGKYGRLRQTYLREHRPVLYNTMLLDGLPLKASAQLEWGVRMNSIRNRAAEIVLTKVVYE